MELIKFSGKGTGFGILIAVLVLILIVITLLVQKSSKKIYIGRIVIPVFFIELAIFFGIQALGFPARGDEVGPGKVSVFIAMTILYIIIMQFIGYNLATIIYLISGMYYLAYRDWKVMISLTAGWILFSYFAFYRLLYVPLPRGLLIEWIFG